MIEIPAADFPSLPAGTTVHVKLKGTIHAVNGVIVGPYTHPMNTMPSTVVRTDHPDFPEVAVMNHTVEHCYIEEGLSDG